MNRFAIARAASFEQASNLVQDRRFALPVLKAGGVDVLDHMKERLVEPDLLVDVRRLDPEIVHELDTIRIGATATLADIAASPHVRQHAPAVAHAVESAATPQIRNMASAAGNLLQRPRCWYYRNRQFNCLKKGGHTCYAVEGENKFHAVLGGGPCHIVHPSNLAVAMMVCGGVVHVTGGDRDSLPVSELFHLPERGLRHEHELRAGEVVTHLTLDATPWSAFYAVKEKQSFDWPLVMAAAALELDGSVIRSARICVGAVAPVPWPLPHVAEALRGVRADDGEAVRKACEHAARGARPLSDNAYKVDLLPVAVARAVRLAAGAPIEALT
jgi:xanthine dehydrogenase YagS FAD-binding subunit